MDVKLRTSFVFLGFLVVALLATVSVEGAPYERLVLKNMTGYVVSPYTVGSNGTALAGLEPWRAFDGDLHGDGSAGSGDWQSRIVGVFVNFDLGAGNATVVNAYNVSNTGYGASRQYDWAGWNFSGSNDNTTWTPLDSRTGIAQVVNGMQQFNFTNAVAYRYYRWQTTSYQGNTAEGLIGELILLRDLGPGPDPIITASLSNAVNGSSFGSVTFSNVTGSLTFSYFNISDTGFCVSYSGNGTGTNCTSGSGASTYFNVSNTTTIIGSQSITASTYQALLNVSAYRLFLNTSINSFNATNSQVTNQTTTDSVQLYALVGNNNVKVDVAGNYSLNTTCTVSTPLATEQCAATGIYDSLFKINATNTSGNPITAFHISISNSTLGYSLLTQATTNGTAYIPALQGYYYEFIMNSTGYSNTTAYINANASTQNYTFSSVKLSNAIYLEFYDAVTLSRITGNITVTGVNGASYFSSITNVSSLNMTGLDVGEWTLTITSTGYVTAQYFVTVSDSSSYSDNIYLTQGTKTVIFTTIDSVSSDIITNATIQMYGPVNGTQTLITTSITDVTGSSELTYTPNVAYTFNISANGYTTRTFTLNPIIYTTYNIKMVRPVLVNFSSDYQSVQMTYTPQTFYANQTNTFTVLFNSITDSFTSYSYNISYPGGSKAGSGATGAGQTFITTFNITGATISDNVNITLRYNTGYGDHEFNYTHNIIIGPPVGTFAANAGETYGMGLLERALIGTIIILIAAGIISLAVSPIAGLFVAMFLMGLFIKIGLWEWWLAGISFLVGVIIIIRRTE